MRKSTVRPNPEVGDQLCSSFMMPRLKRRGQCRFYEAFCAKGKPPDVKKMK
jgi:hypothetical protein